MRQVWTDNDHCTLDGTPFEFGRSGYATLQTTDEKVWVLKNKIFYDLYDRFLAGRTPSRILEIGIFEGGSAMLFADKWPEAKIASLDIRPQNDAVLRHLDRLGFADRVSLHYNVSQDDEEKVRAIIDRDLDGSPDMVIDDASHLNHWTRKTFEIVFPRLARGGLYIIEDWAWAHTEPFQAADHPWQRWPALSNLVFELSMMAASSPHLISEIYLMRSLVVVKKACGVMPDGFRLEDHYLARGRKLNEI